MEKVYAKRGTFFKCVAFKGKLTQLQLITSLWGEKMDTEMPTGCKEVVQRADKICQLLPVTAQHMVKSSYNHTLQEHNI